MELQANYRFDTTEVDVEGDLLLVHAHGVLSLETAQQMLQLFQLMYEKHGLFYMLGDLKEGGGIPPEVRRMFAKGTLGVAPAAVAIYGGSLEVRAANALMMGAVKMLGGPPQNITYFPTAVQAQEWLAAERKRLTAA